MGEKYKSIDGYMFKNMLSAGYRYLDARKKEVDALNIFPVPDGDTGINMSMTIGSADKYAQKVEGGSIADVAGAAATGSLYGARGNSGVILSQIMRGIAKGLENLDQANAEQMAQAFKAGVEAAYKAVMRPVEGTILTVSSELAKGTLAQARAHDDDVVSILRAGYTRGQQALRRTPDLLPALKQAGVVDAGGVGFLLIIEGWIAALEKRVSPVGESGEAALDGMAESRSRIADSVVPDSFTAGITEIVNLAFPYCTEFLVQGENLDPDQIRSGLADVGDSLLVVGTPQVVKIHVHTDNPGSVLAYAVRFGMLHEVAIHNMLSQNEAVLHARKQDKAGGSDSGTDMMNGNTPGDPTASETDQVTAQAVSPRKKYGMAAVAVGEGIAEIFMSLGVDQIVHGGQTMNPSAHDIVQAVRTIPAENVFVFPNNGNIIMAARQADELIDNQKIIVIPSRSIPQGIAGVLEFSLNVDVEENEREMTEALGRVGSGEVTFAVRDWEAEGMAIKSGQVLGLVDDKIVSGGESVVEVAQKVLEGLQWREKSLVTIFCGEETKQEDIDALNAWLAAEDGSVETEVYEGKQPLYYFIIGVE
ncbi:MAG: DAK2 domain-containing protein [Gracilibacteraceae bacterium]|jgi:DAK2 domain fusion protein YloV|nr:DAK2 domain-containing protein [Gracilibacteraceae bacterium]